MALFCFFDEWKVEHFPNVSSSFSSELSQHALYFIVIFGSLERNKTTSSYKCTVPGLNQARPVITTQWAEIFSQSFLWACPGLWDMLGPSLNPCLQDCSWVLQALTQWLFPCGLSSGCLLGIWDAITNLDLTFSIQTESDISQLVSQFTGITIIFWSHS